MLQIRLWVKRPDSDPVFLKELEVLAVPRVGETLLCPPTAEEYNGGEPIYEVTVLSVAHCATGRDSAASISVYGQHVERG